MSLKAPTEDVIRNRVIVNFFENLAPSLKFSIQNDHDALSQLDGLLPVISLGPYDIAPEDFFKFLRSIVAGNTSDTLYDYQGEALTISGSMQPDGSAILSNESHQFRFEIAALLSESSDVRTQLLTTFFQSNTLSQRDEQYWLERVKQSALSNEEYSELEERIGSSVERELFRLRKMLIEKDVNINECLPEHEDTFFALLGESEAELSFSEYLENVYLPRCESFFDRGLVQAIKLIGPSCVLPNEAVINNFKNYNADELYDAVEEVLDSGCDPFTYSFLLDICIYIIDSDSRFNALGSRIIEKLAISVDDSLAQDFTIAIPIVLNALMKSPNLQAQPLYYSRLAAWTWGGLITRLLSGLKFDRPQFLKSVKDRVSFEYSFVGTMERRDAPYWCAEWLSIDNLQGLVHRRVEQSLHCLEKKGKEVPKEWRSIMDASYKHANEENSSLYHYFPGPFDELAQEDFKLIKNIPGSKKLLQAKLSDKSDIDFLAGILNFVNIFEIEEGFFSEIKKCAERINNFGIDTEDTNKILQASQTLGYIAGIYRDPELAILTVNIVHSLTIKTSGETALFECYLIIYAACAYNDNQDYNIFIRNNIERLSNGALSQYQAEICLEIVDQISFVDPSLRLLLGRAKASFNISRRHAK